MTEVLDLSALDRFRNRFSPNRKVRILLDLDGAIAAEGALPEGSFTPFSSSGYATWQIRYSVLSWLVDRRDDSRVELVWSTTWQQYANSILEELGLEPIEWIRFDETYQSPGDWYKKDGLRLFLQDTRAPVAILDDELPLGLLESDPRALLIRPNSVTGVTDEQLAQIDSFIEDVRGPKK